MTGSRRTSCRPTRTRWRHEGQCARRAVGAGLRQQYARCRAPLRRWWLATGVALPVPGRKRGDARDIPTNIVPDGIEDGLAVRQHGRPPVAQFTRAQLRERVGLAAARVHAGEADVIRRRDEDVSSVLQAWPRGLMASATVTGAPREIETFFSFSSAKKAIHCPSGEKNGFVALSVPVIGCDSNALSGRR